MSEDASITCVEAVSLLKLIVRVEESADPNASRELARRNRLALQHPDRAYRPRSVCLRELFTSETTPCARLHRNGNGMAFHCPTWRGRSGGRPSNAGSPRPAQSTSSASSNEIKGLRGQTRARMSRKPSYIWNMRIFIVTFA